MKLTTRSEYALLALVYLARRGNGEPVPLSRIASAQKIPAKYLEQLAVTMCRAGYLASAKGSRGGYSLAKPAGKITLAEVIRLFDGALAPSGAVSRYFYKATAIERERKLVSLMKGIRDYIAGKLETATIRDMV